MMIPTACFGANQSGKGGTPIVDEPLTPEDRVLLPGFPSSMSICIHSFSSSFSFSERENEWMDGWMD